MKLELWSGYLAKVGLGAGVAVVLGGAPIVAHAEDDMPSSPIETQAGNAASGAADNASDTTSEAADKANSAATGAADRGGTVADDSAITDAVKSKLAKAGSDASDIKVDTDSGVVTLSGTVQQKSTRDHAVKVAKKAKGVKSVKDDIEVAAPAK